MPNKADELVAALRADFAPHWAEAMKTLRQRARELAASVRRPDVVDRNVAHQRLARAALNIDGLLLAWRNLPVQAVYDQADAKLGAAAILWSCSLRVITDEGLQTNLWRALVTQAEAHGLRKEQQRWRFLDLFRRGRT